MAVADQVGVADAHGELSSVHRAFMDFVERHPESLERASFPGCDRRGDQVSYPLQPWPTFVSSPRMRALEAVNQGLFDLVRGLPERVFGNDPARIGEFYGIPAPTARIITAVAAETPVLAGALGRADYIYSSAGLQCLEFNISSRLGGWGAATWAESYLSVPLIARFLAETGVEIRILDPLESLLLHLVEHALAHRRHDAPDLNLALALAGPAVPAVLGRMVEETYLRILARRGDGLTGTATLCHHGQLEERGRFLYLGRHRIDALLDGGSGDIPTAVLSCLLSGAVTVHCGPPTRILTDKRNIALLSELADAGFFSPAENELVRRHVPWSRCVVPEYTDRGGERVYLPEHLLAARQELVLKRGMSLQGEAVVVGGLTPEAAWARQVEEVLASGRWMVQERVESLPFVYLSGERGCAVHDVVWGLFAFGDRAGGGFLRVLERGRSGIVNAARGAFEGILFEVTEGPPDTGDATRSAAR